MTQRTPLTPDRSREAERQNLRGALDMALADAKRLREVLWMIEEQLPPAPQRTSELVPVPLTWETIDAIRDVLGLRK
jgi:hypothetical protein